MRSSYGVGISGVDSLGLCGSGNFALESTLKFGLSLLKVSETVSSLQKKEKKKAGSLPC